LFTVVGVYKKVCGPGVLIHTKDDKRHLGFVDALPAMFRSIRSLNIATFSKPSLVPSGFLVDAENKVRYVKFKNKPL
jgi:hypothetical protein